jgi:hypothetical protein
MCYDVADHLIQVSALHVEAGAGVVFRHPPHAVALVPECGPPRVLLQDASAARLPRAEARWSRGHRPAGDVRSAIKSCPAASPVDRMDMILDGIKYPPVVGSQGIVVALSHYRRPR